MVHRNLTWCPTGNNSKPLLPAFLGISQGCHGDHILPELLLLSSCFLFLVSLDASSSLPASWGSLDTVPTWGGRIQLSSVFPDSRLWTGILEQWWYSTWQSLWHSYPVEVPGWEGSTNEKEQSAKFWWFWQRGADIKNSKQTTPKF